MIENRQYVDIWEHIMIVLKRKSSVEILTFLSTFAFGNTMKRTSDIFDIKPSQIKAWNSRIINEIKSLCIKKGINMDNVTNLIGDKVIYEAPKKTSRD